MGKIYIRADEVQRIAMDAAMRKTVIHPDFDEEGVNQAINQAIGVYAAEINAQPGQAVQGGNLPPAIMIQLKCGLMYVVTAENYVVDTTERGLII